MREPAARSRRSRSPARPRRCPPAPRPGPASWCPLCASLRLGVVDLEARPSPPALRHPPHRWGFSLLCTSHPGPAAHGRRRQAPQPGLSRPAAHASPSTPAVPGVLVGDRRRFEGRPGPAAHGRRRQAPQPGLSRPAAHASPSTPAVPGVLVGDRRRFEGRPGPAAHGRRRQAPQPGLSRPAAHASPSTPAVPGVLVGDRRRFEGRPGPAAAPGYRSWAPAGGCMPCVDFQSGPLGGLQPEDLAGGVSPTCRVLV